MGHLSCLSSREDLLSLLIFSHSWGSALSCISQMRCVFPPSHSSVPLHTLGGNCSELLTLGFGSFSWRLVAVPYLTWTSMFSGWEIDLYTKIRGLGVWEEASVLNGTLRGRWSYFTKDSAEHLWFTLLFRRLFYVLLWFSDFSWFGFGNVKSRQGVGK